jgi:large subunit ribosomal protein L4
MATETTAKKTTTTSTLPKSVFAVEIPNHELLKLAYNAYLANGRENHAKTLTRGLVSGGGKKPWKQKGTGRARFGSSRNPIWRHGGVVFGPQGNENYSITIPTRTKRVALRRALTVSAQAGKVVVFDAFNPVDGKVKETLKLLAANKVADGERVLLALENKGDMETRATRNIANLKAVQAKYLNVYDILNADKLLISKKALAVVEEWLGA